MKNNITADSLQEHFNNLGEKFIRLSSEKRLKFINRLKAFADGETDEETRTMALMTAKAFEDINQAFQEVQDEKE